MIIISIIIPFFFKFSISENLRTSSEFCLLKKLSWWAKIFSTSFCDYFATIMTLPRADFPKKQNSALPTLDRLHFSYPYHRLMVIFSKNRAKKASRDTFFFSRQNFCSKWFPVICGHNYRNFEYFNWNSPTD